MVSWLRPKRTSKSAHIVKRLFVSGLIGGRRDRIFIFGESPTFDECLGASVFRKLLTEDGREFAHKYKQHDRVAPI